MGRSQGLIITLVIFIILTLALGVVTYFMAQGYKEVAVKFESANKEVETSKSTIATLNTNLDKIKEKVGYPGIEADQLLQSMDTDIAKALVDSSKAPKTYRDAVAELGKNLTARNQEVASYKQQMDDYRIKYEAEVAKTRAQKDAYDAQRKQADTTYAAQRDAEAKKLQDLETSYQEQTKEVDKIKVEAAKINEKFRVEKADAEEVAASIAEINTGLSKKLDQLSAADFEIPDGKVLYVDQTSRTLRVNVGKQEGLRPLIRFGVYPSDSLDVGQAAAKGSIEIVRILGDHEAEARIVEDEMNNPIMPNDMIFTPLWKRGDETVYAFTYKLDVDGDGKSDLELLRNLVESAGGRVALWVDDDGKIQGELTPDVTALITSNDSILEVLASDRTKDDASKTTIQNEHMKLIEDARLQSVREMKLAEFLRRVHYRDTAQVSRYAEEGGLGREPMGNASPLVSTSPVAPIYLPNQPKAPTADGITAPIYGSRKGEVAPVSSGKVSDFYFRKRTP
ncbi:MAG: hypothetical protein Q4G68_05385 [Planctomycetia bacterium]|nr:hypothetical protein [Planctomycetia bacterium]